MTATTHAQLRAAERYGVVASPQDWDDALIAITSRVMGLRAPALMVGKTKDGQERWVVRIAGVAMLVVYAPATATIVTVLEPQLRPSEAAMRSAENNS